MLKGLQWPCGYLKHGITQDYIHRLVNPGKGCASIVISTSVCLSVRQDISGMTRLISTNFLWMLPMALDRFSSSRATKSQGEGAVLGFSSPLTMQLYSVAFGSHTKTAEPIEMTFGTMSGLDPRKSAIRGGDDPKGKRQFFW